MDIIHLRLSVNKLLIGRDGRCSDSSFDSIQRSCCYCSFGMALLCTVCSRNVIIILQSVIHSLIYYTQFWQFFKATIAAFLALFPFIRDLSASTLPFFSFLTCSIFSSKSISKLMSFIHSCWLSVYLSLFGASTFCQQKNVVVVVCVCVLLWLFVNRIFMHKCRYRLDQWMAMNDLSMPKFMNNTQWNFIEMKKTNTTNKSQQKNLKRGWEVVDGERNRIIKSCLIVVYITIFIDWTTYTCRS